MVMVMVRLPRSAGWWRAAVRAKLGEAPARKTFPFKFGVQVLKRFKCNVGA
jgi:hypothetical protein